MKITPSLFFTFFLASTATAAAGGFLIDDFEAGPLPGSGSISSTGVGFGTPHPVELVTGIDTAHNLWGEREISVLALTTGGTASATFGPDLSSFVGGGLVLDISPLSSAQFVIGYGTRDSGGPINPQSFDLTAGDAFSVSLTEAPTSGSLYMFAYEASGTGNWRHDHIGLVGPGEYAFEFDDFSEEFSGERADMTRVGSFFIAIIPNSGSDAERVVLSEVRVVPEPGASVSLIAAMALLAIRRRRP